MKSYQNGQDRQSLLPGFGNTSTPQQPTPILGKRETSRQAAASVARIAPSQRMLIFEHVARLGGDGATREEIGIALKLSQQSVTPRVLELITQGLLIETEKQRPTLSGRQAYILVAIQKADRSARGQDV